ncbi:translation initiation factor IF-2 [Paludisphaera soli]|uniref:translation initiation factor IF-2 n=1 Tax=Paludisphaera soli TaxID=2712865 RepID=UPI0021BCE932|nr:translation initiation factor IF-2 [Paludisphaera soli]
MSTRVHELAKELGLKSQDLLDRIQKWNLDVKANALAVVDPPTVEQIRDLMTRETKGGPAPAAKSAPVEESPRRPAAKAAEAPPTKTPPTPKAAPPPAPAVEASAPTPAAATPPPAATSPAAATTATPSTAATAAPAPAASAATTPAPSAGRLGPTPTPAPGRAGAGSPPVSRPSGPLSGHTPHRAAGAGPRPGESRAPQPAAGQSPSPTSPQQAGGGPPSFQPLKRSEYMSSAGIRPPVQRTGSHSAPPPAARRAGEEGRRPADETAEAARRDASGPRRPLPPVAPPLQSSGPPRPQAGSPSRPASASSAAEKTQRPEKRMTREDMLAMMRAGQIGPNATAAPRPSGPLRPGGPGGLAARPAPGRPGAPPSGPASGPSRGPVARGPSPGPLGQAPPPLAPPAEEDDDRKKGKGVGSSADRAGRRARRNERATDRRVSSPQPAAALLNEDEEARRGRSGRRPHHKSGGRHASAAQARKSHAEVEAPITVRTLSEALGVKANDLLRKLMAMGQMATINANLDDELAIMLAMEFGMTLDVTHERTAEDDFMQAFAPVEQSENLKPRPPVITILGHVDHGKTSLLDRIRTAKVVESESGGITQHIGAYQVDYNGNPITFVDTPGHEAFTAMRARGANVTDIVVLVVAADDGVMPQTVEAIAHAKAAEVPIVVALNKIDIPNVDTNANISKIYGELAQQGLNPVEWGGDVEVVKTSATTGQGVSDLLATLETIAELHELKADPDRPATGTCLEASISEGRGVVATVLVREGTLKVGDVVVCGDGYGRVRALFDDRGRPVEKAGPSFPVEISGLDVVPVAGENFAVTDDLSRAREVAETRRLRTRDAAQAERQTVTLENLYNRMAERKVKSLNLIVKADVQGSIEAIIKELEKLENAEVPIRILLKGVGGISESDVILADASQAIIIGYRVAPEDRAISLADERDIEIRRYDIIYQVTDDVKKAVEGMLVPEIKEVHLGRAVVRQVFRISKVGAVAGCFVTQGVIERSAKVRLIREGREIYKGAVDALKRFKEDVKEVPANFECGIKITNFDDVKADDVIEAYRVDVIRRTL